MDIEMINHVLENNRNPQFGYHKVEGYETLFSLNSEMKDIGSSFGIIYSDDGDMKTLHKHGKFSEVEKLYKDKYEKLDFFDFRLLEVPVEDYLWVNTVINHSASPWLDRLIARLDIFDVEIIEKDD